MGQHTEAFKRIMESNGGNQIYTSHDVNFAEAKSFVDKLSRELSEEIVNRIIKHKASKSTKFVTNQEIWAFCKNNSIEPDMQDSQQGVIDFEVEEVVEEKVDYAKLDEYDDFKHEGKECFVVSNDTEKREIVFRDHDEMEKGTLNY
jgi:hypothetical protein